MRIGELAQTSGTPIETIRFYERVSTTVLNAYVGPKLGHYLDQLVERLAGIGFDGFLLATKRCRRKIRSAFGRIPRTGRVGISIWRRPE